jgi:hypothetical protein
VSGAGFGAGDVVVVVGAGAVVVVVGAGVVAVVAVVAVVVVVDEVVVVEPDGPEATECDGEFEFLVFLEFRLRLFLEPLAKGLELDRDVVVARVVDLDEGARGVT